ncbi:MAG: hypothetical protein IKF19_01120 [Bacilli bacterium]|nr:hypothetical protein [Bacilli bacterium]
MNYIEMIKKVDEVFPQTTDFDYRTLPTNEMLERIETLLKDLDVYGRLSEEELKHLNNVLTQWYSPVLTNKSFVLGRRDNGENYLDYDQSNQYIKRNVLHVKNYVMELITNYINNPNNSYSVEQTGSIGEIEEHINPENITKYITKLFTISKEKGTSYDSDILLSEIITDITYHYGIKKEMGEEGSRLIREKFDNAVRESSAYSADVTNLDGMAFHSSVSQDSEQFKAEIGKSIKDIIKYVETVTGKRLDELKEREKRRAERQAQSTITESRKDSYENGGDVSLYLNFAETVEKYERIQGLIKRQNEIMKRIAAIEAEKKKLEAEKRELEEEFKENDKVIKGGSNAL